MKLIVKCVADDGSEWDRLEDAQARDEEIKAVREIMDPIGPGYSKHGDCSYFNGHGYVQRNPAVVDAARRRLLSLSYAKARDWFDQQENDHGLRWPESFLTVDWSWFNRILGDRGHDPIACAWYRLGKIDAQGREWGQPGYAEDQTLAEVFEIKVPGSPSPAVP